MNKKQLIEMIAARDSISFNEAEEAVNNCIEQIYDVMTDDCGFALYDAVADIVQYELGLEPDYIEVLLD